VARFAKYPAQYDDIGIVTDKTGARLVRMNALSKPKQVNVVSTGWIPPAISNLNGVEQARFSSLMSRFQNMITSDNVVNKIQTAELRIVSKSDKVISYHPYRLSLAERQKIREMVSDLLSNKIIQESESPYASPVLLVKKKTAMIDCALISGHLTVSPSRTVFPYP
jgi:hypothetical protein